jgi:DNA transposition AAA+ family ATPase
MRPGIIHTDNVRRGLFAVADLKRRCGQASKRNLLVLEGLTGAGKTCFSEWVYTQNTEMHYLEADPDWTASWLMRDVAGALGHPRGHSIEANKRQVVEGLKSGLHMLIMDEADRVIRSTRLLDTVRGLHDAGLPLILVGESGAWGSICRKSPRFADRVGQVLTFGPVAAAEIEAAARELADLRLAPDLAAYIQQQAGGNFRRAIKILEELEGVAKANVSEKGEITRAGINQALKHLQLSADREQRRVSRRAAAAGG